MKIITSVALAGLMTFSCVSGMMDGPDFLLLDLLSPFAPKSSKSDAKTTKPEPKIDLSQINLNDYKGVLEAGTCTFYYRPEDIHRIIVQNMGKNLAIHAMNPVSFDIEALIGAYLLVNQSDYIKLVEMNTGKIIKNPFD